MNFQDLSGRVRGVFKPRELQAPAPSEGAAPGQQQAPVTIIMPGQQGRKLSTPVVVIGVCLVAFALYFAGHSSAKVDTPASRGNSPTPTSAANIKDWNKPVATSPVIVETRSPAQQAEDAYQKSQAEQLAMMQRSGQPYAGQAYPGQVPPGVPGSASGPTSLTPAQQLAEDRRKADEESLRASNVIAIAEPPAPERINQQQPSLQYTQNSPYPGVGQAATPPGMQQGMTTNVAPVPSVEDKTRKDCVDRMDGDVKKYALCEGAVLPAISEFRLVGEFAGPVKAEIASDIFSRDGKHILIPRGTIALGDAKRVGTANQRRMDVTFHRMILPDGRGVVLEKMIALDQAGETALSGKLNRHLVSTFGTAAVMGGLAGFSQIGSGSSFTGGGIDAYRQGVASSTSQQAQSVLQQGLNRPPEITVPEGKFLMIYLSDDLHLPEFVPVPKTLVKTDAPKGEDK